METLFQEKTFTLPPFLKERLVPIFIAFIVGCVSGAAFMYLGMPFLYQRVSGAADTNESEIVDVISGGVKEEIVVELAGAVYKPGVYKAKVGDRVIDLLSFGEGVESSASIEWVAKNLNLARILSDSEKIYIPFEWDVNQDDLKASVCGIAMPGGSEGDINKNVNNTSSSSSSGGDTSDTTAGALVNINSADTSTLDTLPGIGPTYAQKIIDSRPYTNIQDLKDRSKVPASTVENLSKLIKF